MSRLLRRLRREDGIAIPVVIGSLAVCTLLGITLLQVSLDGGRAVSVDRDAKRALAAASAGLEMAYLKTTQLRPDANQCVTDVKTAPVAGNCEWTSSISMGNDTTYKYAVTTPAMRSQCPRIPAIPETPNDRCITAMGEVNGVQRRVQSRIVYVPPFMPFAKAGLIAQDVLTLNNSPVVNSTIGANNRIETRNPITVTGDVILGYGGVRNSTHAFTVSPPYTEYTMPAGETWPFPPTGVPSIAGQFAAARAAGGNQNASLGSLYTASSRRFYQASGIATLPGGTYSFCSFETAGTTQLQIPAGQTARIYIDSRLSDSTCPGGTATGTFRIGNAAIVNRDFGQDAGQLEVYVYGTRTDGNAANDVIFEQTSQTWGTFYAPDSGVTFRNSANLVGGVMAEDITMENAGSFTWPTNIRSKTLQGTGQADRRGFFQCRTQPTVSSDPESGCTT